MNQPHFSILLPTRNRPALAQRAIESVIGQAFTNWELIVSDNGDAPEHVAARFVDSRIVKLAPPARLRMWENWQHALDSARGKYVLVITDKCVLAPRALENLYTEYPRFDLCTWRIRRPARLGRKLTTGRIASRDYNELAVWRQFERYDIDTDVFPHGANMAWRRELWPAEAPELFTAANPDYLGGARLLARSKVLRHVDFPVTVIPRDAGVENSVGAAWQLGERTPAVLEFAKDIGRTQAMDTPCTEVLVMDFMRWNLWPAGMLWDSRKVYWRWIIDRLAARRALSPEQRAFARRWWAPGMLAAALRVAARAVAKRLAWD